MCASFLLVFNATASAMAEQKITEKPHSCRLPKRYDRRAHKQGRQNSIPQKHNERRLCEKAHNCQEQGRQDGKENFHFYISSLSC
jgi:5-methylcytosine-specific restriction endonuclease McrA